MLHLADSAVADNPFKAQKLYKEILKNLDKNDEKNWLEVYHKIGYTSYLLGEYPEAIMYMKKAMQYIKIKNKEKNKDRYTAKILVDLGSAYYFSNSVEPEKTRRYFSDSYDLFKKNGFEECAALSLNYSAYTYWQQGEKEKALSIHKEAYRILDSLHYLKGKAISCSDIGFTLNSLNQYNEALEYNLNALTLSKELNDSIIMIPILNNVAISYANLGENRKAIHFSEQSLAMAKKRKLRLRMSEALAELHHLYLAIGETNKAYGALLQFKQIDDSLRSSAQFRKLIQLENKIDNAEKDKKNQITQHREKYLRYLLILSVLFLLSIGFFLFLRFRAKSRYFEVLSDKNEEMKVLIEKVRDMQTKLIQNEKLSTVGLLLGGICHEFNNPLNIIMGGVYFIEEDIDSLPKEFDKKNILDSIGYIRNGSSRISEIIDDIKMYYLDFSKEKSECNIHSIIDNCLRINAPSIESNTIEIQKKYSQRELLIQANSGDLYKVVNSVISNAILAQQKGKRHTIKIVTKVLNDKFLQIIIEDTGVGMSCEVIEHIFDPFYTTREPGMGIGLSLYLTYAIIQRLNGEIEYSTKPENGTEVTITIPLK